MNALKLILKVCGYAIGAIVLHVLSLGYPWISYAVGAIFIGFIVRDLAKEATKYAATALASGDSFRRIARGA